MVLLLFFLLFLMFLLKSQQTKRRNIYSISLKVFFWTEHWLRWKGSVARWLLIWFFFLFVSFFSLIPSSEHVLSCTVLLLLRRELQLLLPRHPHFSHLERPIMAHQGFFLNKSVCHHSFHFFLSAMLWKQYVNQLLFVFKLNNCRALPWKERESPMASAVFRLCLWKRLVRNERARN